MPQRSDRAAYVANRPLCTLRTTELLVVASLRLWLCEPVRLGGGWASGDWAKGLRAAGLEADAIRAFAGLAEIVSAAFEPPLDLRPLRCPTLGGSEAQLLEILRLQQQRMSRAAEAALTRWLAPAASRIVFGLCRDVAKAMGEQGLLFASTDAPGRTPGSGLHAGPSAHANRGLHLVH